MLPDKREQEFLQEAQKIINRLCDANDVPKIPVKFTRKAELLTAAAVFYPKLWEIHITTNTDAHALVHEFTHYLVELVSISDRLNENLTERASSYYEWEMTESKKWSDPEIKKQLDDFNQKFLELGK